MQKNNITKSSDAKVSKCNLKCSSKPSIFLRPLYLFQLFHFDAMKRTYSLPLK